MEEEKICPQCGTSFELQESTADDNTYCSQACEAVANTTPDMTPDVNNPQ